MCHKAKVRKGSTMLTSTPRPSRRRVPPSINFLATAPQTHGCIKARLQQLTSCSDVSPKNPSTRQRRAILVCRWQPNRGTQSVGLAWLTTTNMMHHGREVERERTLIDRQAVMWTAADALWQQSRIPTMTPPTTPYHG